MTDLTKLLAEIQNPERSHVDMIKRRAQGSLQWFLEKDHKTHPIHNNNHLEFFMCGQEGFAAIEKDIRAATSSIDLVLWGFDPGMELVRSGKAWPRGTTYGDLLTAKGREGVKVRLLLWFLGDVPIFNIIASNTKNAPDIGPMSGLPIPSGKRELRAPVPGDRETPWMLTDRANYCSDWWNKALHGAFVNVEVRLRKAHPEAIAGNASKYLPSAGKTLVEAGTLTAVGTHHQKPILIDYAPDKSQGKKPNTCGYVMGLNSVTDYWDTTDHRFNEPMRELSPYWIDAFSTPWHLKPYRDYAIRVQGEALYNINENFVQGWDSADGYGFAHGATIFSASLENQRKHVRPKDIPVPPGARCRAQILRTFPDKRDATILKAYTLAASNATNYIYVENQYFQLAEWPRTIKKIREKYCDGMTAAGAKPADIAPLHVIVVTPQPERGQMVPNTYDALNQLGEGQTLATYDKQVQGQRKALAEGKKPPSGSGGGVVRDSLDASPVNPKGELDALGIKALAAMLMTYDSNNEAKDIRIKDRDSQAQNARAKQEEAANSKAGIRKGKANDVDPENLSEFNITPVRYREIYIHSKLMLVDDIYTTLGSANLNARSMVGDSEFNICTEEWSFTKAARKRVWGNLAGVDLDGKECSRDDMAQTFGAWEKRMANNRLNRDKNRPPESGSFIHPFEDSREAPSVRFV